MSPKKGPNQKKMSLESRDVLLHYGNLIHKYRKKSMYSRSEVCEKVDISNSQLSTWESGKAEPRLHSMLRICELLDIPLEELFFDVKSREMTAEELKIVKMLRDTPENTRKQIIALIGAITNTPDSDAEDTTSPIIDDGPEDEQGATNSSISEVTNKNTDEDEPIIDDSLLSETEETSEILLEKPMEPKKKRGRPPKVTVTSSSINDSILGEPVKKRGRPKKTESTDIQDKSQKSPSKRGRPRKNALAPESTNAINEDSSAGKESSALNAETPQTISVPMEPEKSSKKKRGRPRKTQT